VVALIVGCLQGAAAVGLGDGRGHGLGNFIGVEDDLAADVTGGPAAGLDEGALGAQEPFLVGVEDGDQGDLGEVEALAQEVDADEDVKDPQAQVPDDLHALEGGDVGVEVADFYP